jgi:TetR/AcrR family transcriptional regulator of autoinduction and epiphytic fitness
VTERPADGRLARGVRAREAIAGALIDLLDEGVERPTARQLAERAGVSLRLVFHHFEDMESVLRSAVGIQVQRHWQKLEPVAPDVDLARRVKDTVRGRCQLYEAIAPVRRAAALASGRSPTVARELEAARRILRSQLRHTFSPEVTGSTEVPGSAEVNGNRGSDTTAALQRDLLDALEVATSFETWDHLRTQSGRSAAATRRVVERLVTGVLTTRSRSGS